MRRRSVERFQSKRCSSKNGVISICRFKNSGQLELHPDKTRRIEFGRYAERNREQRGEGKPETFDFLGLTHISRKNRKGTFTVRCMPTRKRMRAKLQQIKQQLRRRMHDPVAQTGAWLKSVLRGYFNYAVPGNRDSLNAFSLLRVLREHLLGRHYPAMWNGNGMPDI